MADAIKVAHAVLDALWAEEKNTGDPATLQAIIAGCGLDADAVMKASEAPEIAEPSARPTPSTRSSRACSARPPS